MNQTTNYQLSQWDAEDRILREDFNANNAKLEQALTAQAEARESLAEQLAKCGNCRLVTTSYVGNGGSGSSSPCQLTFDAEPVVVMVAAENGTFMLFHRNGTQARQAGSSYYCTVTWSGNTLSWYHANSNTSQFNAANTTYYVFAWFVTQ